MAADPYAYPGTDVLRNLLDLRDAAVLAEREAALSAIRIAQLERRFTPGDFDLAHPTTLFADLAHEDRLHGLGREQFLERLTHYYAEINAVHPFREGNGRIQRAFLGQIAKTAGHPIAWVHLDAERNILAARESHRGDNSLLHEMLDDLLE